jgi:hypothetical protein
MAGIGVSERGWGKAKAFSEHNSVSAPEIAAVIDRIV